MRGPTRPSFSYLHLRAFIIRGLIDMVHLVQLSHSAYCVRADPFAGGACRQDRPDIAQRRPLSSTSLLESNDEAQKAGALEGLGGLESRRRVWFPRFPWLLDRRVLHGRLCGS